MNSEESISEMFMRFTNITNALKSLGKVYTNAEMVSKVLRSLPKRWEPKVTAIEEAKDLSTLQLDELLGSLMTHEINVKAHEVEKKPKRNLALKSSNLSSEDEEEDSDEDYSDDEMMELSRKFKKYMMKKAHRHLKKERFKENSNKKNSIKCYECKRPGHVRPDCPYLKEDIKRYKKAMKTTWKELTISNSDEDTSDDEKTNLVLTAFENEVSQPSFANPNGPKSWVPDIGT